jgi:hypothetical protein
MAWLPKVHLGVIDDARRRQRRRWLGLATAGIAAAAALVLALDRPASERPVQPAPTAALLPPGKVFSEAPYMGVTCRVPNSTVCDDIGLAVWLKRRAVTVRAEIAGRAFALRREAWRRNSPYTGFLRDAGLRTRFRLPAHWEGQPPRDLLARVRIDYGRGAPVETRVRVSLSPGWG